VWLRRISACTGETNQSRWLLTERCANHQITRALTALAASARCQTFRVPALSA
jgi:hypothetical protein